MSLKELKNFDMKVTAKVMEGRRSLDAAELKQWLLLKT